MTRDSPNGIVEHDLLDAISATPSPNEIRYKTVRIELSELAGRPYAKAWRGKAKKPFANYVFPTPERRERWIAEVKEAEDARERFAVEQAKHKETALAKMRGELKPGVILHTSWGYDQTNVEFFEVIRVPSPYTVVIRELAGTTVETGFMCGTKTAKPHEYVGPELVRRIGAHGIRIDDVRTAWIGKESHHVSWYA